MGNVSINDFNNLAKILFEKLDQKDGTSDKKIDASIWNAVVVGDNGIRNNNANTEKNGQITESIGENDAINSLRGYLSHAYYENKEKFETFVQSFGINSETFEEDPSLINDDENVAPTDGTKESDDVVNKEPEVTEDTIPSVLRRNTALVTVAQIIHAIKNPAYRHELSLKFTTEEKAAFEEACKKYDEAKKSTAGLKKEVKKGYDASKVAKSQINTIEDAEKNLTKAEQAKNAAENKVKLEQSRLEKNAEYQKLKSQHAEVQEEIQKLEAKRNSNRSKKLSHKNQARLDELKSQEAALKGKMNKLEANLTKANGELKTAKTQYENASIEKQALEAKNGVDAAKNKAKDELKALNENPEYKDARNQLKKVNAEIKKLEEKPSLTKAEQKQLTQLKSTKETLNSKIGKLSKNYRAAKSEVKVAESQAKALDKAATKGVDSTKAALLKKVKKGNNKVRINLKKIPKAKLAEFSAKASKVSAAAKASGRALRGLGKVAKPIMAIVSAVDIYNAYQQGGKKQAVRTAGKLGVAALGAWGGAKAGAAIGTGIGACFGGVGAPVGGVIGGVIGGIGGWAAGEKVYDAGEQIIFSEEQIDNIGATGTVETTMTEEEISALLEEDPDAAEYLEIVE